MNGMWCRFGIHQWLKWTPPEMVKGRMRAFIGGVPIEDWTPKNWFVQTRICEYCGKYEERKID